MDFELTYSQEQEEFRKEVRAWLDANIPREFEDQVPVDQGDGTEAQFLWAREFERKLGAKGWFAPTAPKQYGGGGLSMGHAIVLAEELSKHQLPSTGNVAIRYLSHALLAWGTEEQKRSFLPPVLRGDWAIWQLFTEPEAGSDLASLKSRAVEDGDDYVINGNKIFVGEQFYADYLYTLAVTDPAAPRHQNMGAFLIPAQTPGITMYHMDLISGSGKRTVFFEDVRVPKDYLIGGKTQGWWVANTTLEVEHGGGGRVAPRNNVLDHTMAYAGATTRNGQRLLDDPLAQQALAQAHIGVQVGRLLGLRNFWMRHTGRRGTYEGSQSSLQGKRFSPELARTTLDLLGPWTLISNPDLAPAKGELENHQRQSLSTHPGGTPEIHMVIMSRRMGLSRTPTEQQGSRDLSREEH
ncbi:MAG: acyl-CoA dehydrogenase family protein [Chloroflexi bacterium]|nr:acyl-CoA dehydrogenase family protein [Chloroflexota bacterium]